MGRTAAAEQQVNARLDAAGSRVLVVADAKGQGLLPEAVVDQAGTLSATERVVGTVIPVDVVNHTIGPGGTKVPAWQVVGYLSDVVDLTAGRWPGPGEALVSSAAQTALGMDDPVGAVALASSTDVRDFNVVGSFTPRAPFESYAAGAVIAAPAGMLSDTLNVIVTDSTVAATTQQAVIDLIRPPPFDDLVITSPVTLAQLQEQVSGDLSTFGRTLLLGVLGAGALLVAIVVLADVLVRRKDLGRRRALGATRGTIVTLVIGRTLIPALLGAALGVGIGLWLTGRYDATPPWSFTTGTATLALLAAAASSIPPALYAATRLVMRSASPVLGRPTSTTSFGSLPETSAKTASPGIPFRTSATRVRRRSVPHPVARMWRSVSTPRAGSDLGAAVTRATRRCASPLAARSIGCALWLYFWPRLHA